MKTTALYSRHLQFKAKMTPFEGWNMPLMYSSVLKEHHDVRNKAGIFDVSHMGILFIKITKKDSSFENNHLTTSISNIAKGKIKYLKILNDNKGILDDALAYKFDSEKIMLVVNASNTEKVESYLKDKKISVKKQKMGIIAVQGPTALTIINRLINIKNLKYYNFIETTILGEKVIISRTGYTGEDGIELYTKNNIDKFWDFFIEKGVTPCGLAARDILRIEAGLPLYGHELNQALTDNETKKILGIEMLSKAIPRNKYLVFTNGNENGYITSGTYSPSLDKSIAMAYINNVKAGDKVEVEIRKKRHPAKVVLLPFYKRSKLI